MHSKNDNDQIWSIQMGMSLSEAARSIEKLDVELEQRMRDTPWFNVTLSFLGWHRCREEVQSRKREEFNFCSVVPMN